MTAPSIVEIALQDPERFLGLAGTYAPGMVCLRGLDNKLLYVSPAVENLLGYSPEVFIASFDRIVIEDSEYTRKSYREREKFLSGNVTKGDGNNDYFPTCLIEYKTKSGERVIHELNECFIREKDRRVARISFQTDVTDHLRQVEELQASIHGLMVIHHTQNMIMGITDREELLSVALDAAMSMLEFDQGVVYTINLQNKEARLLACREVEKKICDKIRRFPLSDQATDGTIESDNETTALLFPPGHSWLEPLTPLSDETVGMLFMIHGTPEAFIACSLAQPFSRETQRLFQSIGLLVSRAIEHSYLHDALENLSVIDTVTGLHNRTYAKQFLEREDRLLTRHQKTASVLMLAIEAEKGNDDSKPMTVKPATKDEEDAVHKCAKLVKNCLRTTDAISRFDESKFLFFLPETDELGTQQLVGRLSDTIDEWNGQQNDMSAQLSILTGGATSKKGNKSIPELIREAKEKLERKGQD